MVIDHRQNHLESIRAAASLIIYPLQYLVDLPVSVSRWAGDKFTSREALLGENSKLRMQQTLLLARLQKLSALKVENIRLRELLQSSKKVGENVLIGELLAVDLEPFTRQIIINKGSNDDVYIGQPLLDAQGIMGQVVHVGPISSTAMLISDPNHAIPVHVNRNGLRAIVVGTGAPDRLEIPYLPNSAEIVVGDLLTSSGLGGRFPPDYPVAEVTSVYKDPSQPYAVVSAKPMANLEQSREVLLVWRTDQVAKSGLETTTTVGRGADAKPKKTPVVKPKPRKPKPLEPKPLKPKLLEPEVIKPQPIKLNIPAPEPETIKPVEPVSASEPSSQTPLATPGSEAPADQDADIAAESASDKPVEPQRDAGILKRSAVTETVPSGPAQSSDATEAGTEPSPEPEAASPATTGANKEADDFFGEPGF